MKYYRSTSSHDGHIEDPDGRWAKREDIEEELVKAKLWDWVVTLADPGYRGSRRDQYEHIGKSIYNMVHFGHE